jgi:hypothetical protein
LINGIFRISVVHCILSSFHMPLPLEIQTQNVNKMNHLNTRLVWFLNVHCILMLNYNFHFSGEL